MRVPSASPSAWHKAYLVPIGVPDTPEMRRELAGRVASALLDDITLDIRSSPKSSPSTSPSMQNLNQDQPTLMPLQIDVPVAGPVSRPAPPKSPYSAASSSPMPTGAGARSPVAPSSTGHPSPIARPSRIIQPSFPPPTAPPAPTLNAQTSTRLTLVPAMTLSPALDVQNSAGLVPSPPAFDIHANPDLTSSPSIRLPYSHYPYCQSPSHDHLHAPASPISNVATFSQPFFINSTATTVTTMPYPSTHNNDFAYSACSFTSPAVVSPAMSSTSSLAPANLSPIFMDTLAFVISSIDQNNYNQPYAAGASPTMYQNELQGGQAQQFMDQHGSRPGALRQPPPFSPPAPTAEMSRESVMHSPSFLMSTPILFGVREEDVERAKSVPPHPPLPPSLLPSLSDPAPVNMCMERYMGTDQHSASPVSPANGLYTSSSPSSSPGSSQYTDYMYGYGGNGHWWWDHYLYEQYNYDFGQDDEYCDDDYGDDEMEPLYSFVWSDDEDDLVQCGNVPGADPGDDEGEDDLGENVLDYCGTGTSCASGQLIHFDLGDPPSQDITSKGDNNSRSVVGDGLEVTPPPIENSLDDQDLGDGWTYVALDRNYEREHDSDDLFSFLGTPLPSSSDASHSPNQGEYFDYQG